MSSDKYPTDRAAYLAREAAQDAIDMLNLKKKGDESVNGKFELGAVCLGGMTHFIADVSSPPHVLQNDKWKSSIHSEWEYYGDHFLRTHFTHTESFTSYGNIFPNGGPSWANSDPRTVGKTLTAVDPYVAVMMMSLVSFSACDLGSSGFMGNSAAPNLDKNDPSSVLNSDRVKTLLKWAAFYTACAIMWVLDKCNDNIMGDTISDRFVSDSSAYEAKARDFSSKDALKDYLAEKNSAEFSQYMGNQVANAAVAGFSPILLFTSLSLLGTVSVLVGVPIAGRVNEKEKKTESWLEG